MKLGRYNDKELKLIFHILSLIYAFSLKNCSTFISLHIFALGIKHEILRGLRNVERLTVQEKPNYFFSLDVTLNNQ